MNQDDLTKFNEGIRAVTDTFYEACSRMNVRRLPWLAHTWLRAGRAVRGRADVTCRSKAHCSQGAAAALRRRCCCHHRRGPTLPPHSV